MATTFDIQLPHYSRGFHLITRDIISQLPALPESGLLVLMHYERLYKLFIASL